MTDDMAPDDEGPAAGLEPPDPVPELSGPPEPIVREDGSVEVVDPVGDEESSTKPDATRFHQLGKWSCEQCGTVNNVVEQVEPGDDLPEPQGECEGCDRQGPYTHKEVDAALANRLLRGVGIWDAPSSINKNADDYETLWADLREYLADFWFTDDGALYDGLTAYVLSTWIRDELTFVPHLMLMGKTTAGKTRLLNTLRRVSYRGFVSADATAASLVRLVDQYDTTFYVSEYHGLAYESQRALDSIVRAGQKRGEKATRAEQSATGGYEPKVYDPFTHIGIATQEETADDIANRCIHVRSAPPSGDVDPPMVVADDRADELRNRLLYARFRLLGSDTYEEAEAWAADWLTERGITGRTREKLLALVTLARIFDHVDDLEPFVAEVREQDTAAAADSQDALWVQAVRDLAFEELGETVTLTDGDDDPWKAVAIPYADVCEQFEEMTGEEMTSSKCGNIRKRLGFEKERKRDGTVIQDPALAEKLRDQIEDFNLSWESSDVNEPAPKLRDEQISRGTCPECGNDTTLSHRDAAGHGERVCSECAKDIRAAQQQLTQSTVDDVDADADD